MTDYDGWDDHDDPDFEQYEPSDDLLPRDEPMPELDEGWDEPPADEPDDLLPEDDAPPEVTAEAAGPDDAGADPDAVPEPADDPLDVFPPMVDVGDLPEPVDGFPWIDTGSLGVVDPAAMAAAPDGAPEPAELAEYAAADLPPGQDPWATLADSDDPATAALARFYSPGTHG